MVLNVFVLGNVIFSAVCCVINLALVAAVFSSVCYISSFLLWRTLFLRLFATSSLFSVFSEGKTTVFATSSLCTLLVPVVFPSS